MNNRVYDKTIKNLRNRVNLKLLTIAKSYKKYYLNQFLFWKSYLAEI